MRRNRIKPTINVNRNRGGAAVEKAPVSDRPVTPLSVSNRNDPNSCDLQILQAASSPGPGAIIVASPKSVGSSSSALHEPDFRLTLVGAPCNSPVPSPGVLPFSPGGIQRCPPSVSPASPSPSPKYYLQSESSQSPVPHFPAPLTPDSPRKTPVPASTPGRNSSSSNDKFKLPSLSALHCHNSNSADSHEVAKYMCPSPSSFKNVDSMAVVARKSEPPLTFSSAIKDHHADSIFRDSRLLKARLEKQSPALITNKFQSMRDDVLKNFKPEDLKNRKSLTMLHYAFWNPPRETNNGMKNRNRSSSVSSNRSRRSADDIIQSNSRMSVDTDLRPRRATVDTSSMSVTQDDNDKSQDTFPEESSAAVDEENQDNGSVSVGPRVKVGPDGRLILDEQSLVVETSENLRARKLHDEMETVSGAAFEVGSSGLFRSRKKCQRGHDWSVKETVRFYRALNMCGTDFSMMANLFPGRSRSELKAKFKREDKKNPAQVSMALKSQEFDPNEEISDSEDSEENMNSETDIKSLSDKLKKKFRKRSFYVEPEEMTEAEKRIREEMEESQIYASYERQDGYESGLPEKTNCNSKGGRPRNALSRSIKLDDPEDELSEETATQSNETQELSSSDVKSPDPDNKPSAQRRQRLKSRPKLTSSESFTKKRSKVEPTLVSSSEKPPSVSDTSSLADGISTPVKIVNQITRDKDIKEEFKKLGIIPPAHKVPSGGGVNLKRDGGVTDEVEIEISCR